MLKGLHSVIIWTESLERLAPFYRDVVGLETEMEGDGFVIFRTSQGAQLGLGKHSEVRGRSKDPNRVMVNFGVDDCEAEFKRLKDAGAPFIRPPTREGDGMTIATFTDPDGNVLQLFQEG